MPRLPFFYGWIVIAVAFITMAIAITARTSFSIFYPEILDEFGWSRGVTAGAYSTGFIASIMLLPVVGLMMERFGPRIVIPLGAIMVAGGFVLMTTVNDPISLYVAMGLLIINGSMSMSYIVHSMFIPKWFVRNRGLAIGLAFSGVGVGAILLLPLIQATIASAGWRTTCFYIAVVIVAVIVPLNILFQRAAPEDIGLVADGGERRPAGSEGDDGQRSVRREVILNRAWAETDWTVAKAAMTLRFWAMFLAFFCALFVWYGIQAHQTKFLIDRGFPPGFAAAALGLVALCGIVGQVGIGALSDRIGRELAWTVSLAGFGAASIFMLLLLRDPRIEFVYLAIASQGFLGYGMSAIFGAISTEIFSGRRAASILAVLGIGGNLGGGAGAWVMGALHDVYGSYEAGLWMCWAVSILSMLCIWVAAPGRIRKMVKFSRRPRAQIGMRRVS